MTTIPMICTCGLDGNREAEDARRDIYRRLRPEQMNDLLTAVLISLAFDFGCTDYDIAADMWFGVYLVTPDGPISVECDNPHDGFFAAWLHLADKYPERLTTGPTKNLNVALRISDALFKNYEDAERAYRTHREAAHKDDNDCPPCEDCHVLMMLSILTSNAMEDAWGPRVLDAAIDRAFGD